MVVFAATFWLQSKNTFPGRSDVVIFQTMRSGCAAVSSWAEVQAGAATPGALTQVTADEVLERVATMGDLAATLIA